MPRNRPALEIYIHLANGGTLHFHQEDPADAKALVESIQPQTVFTQTLLVIAGQHSLTAFSPSKIARIDLAMEGYPGWSFPFNAQDIAEVTEEEFQQNYLPLEKTTTREQQVLQPGEIITVYAKIELTNREHFYVQMRLPIVERTPLDVYMFLQQLFTSHTLFARRREGGVILVNAEHLARITSFPGPPKAPPKAWSAHYVAEK
jgi:hypothetical protein